MGFASTLTIVVAALAISTPHRGLAGSSKPSIRARSTNSSN